MRLCSALVIVLACGMAQGDLLDSIGNSDSGDSQPGVIDPGVGIPISIGYGDLLSASDTDLNLDVGANAIVDGATIPPGTTGLSSHWSRIANNSGPNNSGGILAGVQRAYHRVMSRDDTALLSKLGAMVPTRQLRATHSLDAAKALVSGTTTGLAPIDVSSIASSNSLRLSDFGNYVTDNLGRGTIGIPTAHLASGGMTGAQAASQTASSAGRYQLVSAPAAAAAGLQASPTAGPPGVPEPSSFILLALTGLAYAGWYYRRQLRLVGADS